MLLVHLSSERARKAVRQDGSFAEKQESPVALLVVVPIERQSELLRTPEYVGQRARSQVTGSFTGTSSSGPPVEGERHPWMRSPRRSMSRYLATRLARVSGRLASLIRQTIE